MQFHFHANQSHFHKNSFALKLALKQRHKGTRKWPIMNVRGQNVPTFKILSKIAGKYQLLGPKPKHRISFSRLGAL